MFILAICSIGSNVVDETAKIALLTDTRNLRCTKLKFRPYQSEMLPNYPRPYLNNETYAHAVCTCSSIHICISEFMPEILSYYHFSFTLHFKLFSFWFMGRQRTMTLTDSADAMMNMVLNELCLKWK